MNNRHIIKGRTKHKTIRRKKNSGSYKNIKYIISIVVVLFLIVLLIDNSTTIIKRIFPLKYKQIIFDNCQINELDPYLILAVIKAESSFEPNARSNKNAIGLMQITEKTAIWGAESINIKGFLLEDLYDPEINIKIGCWYIRQLMKQFDSDIDLVLAAYNGGSGNVTEWLRNSEYSKTGKQLDIIPFRETSMFVKRVKNYYQVYKRLYGNG